MPKCVTTKELEAIVAGDMSDTKAIKHAARELLGARKRLAQLPACKLHPKYLGKRAPQATTKHPTGCQKCWAIYLWTY